MAPKFFSVLKHKISWKTFQELPCIKECVLTTDVTILKSIAQIYEHSNKASMDLCPVKDLNS
jgi:hypothetical protein